MELRRGEIGAINYEFGKKQTEINKHCDHQDAHHHLFLSVFRESEDERDSDEDEDADYQNIGDIPKCSPRTIDSCFYSATIKPSAEIENGMIYKHIKQKSCDAKQPSRHRDESSSNDNAYHSPPTDNIKFVRKTRTSITGSSFVDRKLCTGRSFEWRDYSTCRLFSYGSVR